MKMIKPILHFWVFILCAQTHCTSQSKNVSYIDYYNFANEAEYHFYEMEYGKAVELFEKAFKIVDSRKPDHHYNYCRALWEVDKTKKSIKELKKSIFAKYFLTDSTYFENMALDTRNKIMKSMEMNRIQSNSNIKHIEFLDSLNYHDQRLRKVYSDSILPYYSELKNDTLVKYYEKLITEQDVRNGIDLINYSKKNGFPAGVNGSWNQSIATVLLHLGRDCLIENYYFLIEELKSGNIEPWMLTQAVDRFFINKSNCDENVSTYNSYFGKNLNDPFLLFLNCKAIGFSPYYGFNWRLYPKGWRPNPTEQYEIYHANKTIYNTTY